MASIRVQRQHLKWLQCELVQHAGAQLIPADLSDAHGLCAIGRAAPAGSSNALATSSENSCGLSDGLRSTTIPFPAVHAAHP